ncbi:permease [Synergistales bacterium]|nr:permease [Synergistales bacterium]
MVNVTFSLLICLGIFAIGDVLAVATKARLSSVFVALMLFLVGFLSGVIPLDIIEKARLTELSSWASVYVVFHMGTTINLGELLREWKTVVMSIFAMIVAVISVFAVIPLIGKEAAIVSIPVVNGGIIATQIMVEAATTKGMALAAALGTIVYAIQKFVGTPPASFFGLKEAELILADYRKKKAEGLIASSANEKSKDEHKETKKTIYSTLGLDKYYTHFTCLGVTAFFCWLAYWLQAKTTVNYSIWALFLGAVAGQIHIVPEKILAKGGAVGLLNMAIFAGIIPSLGRINIADLSTLAFQTIVVFAAVVIGTFIFIYMLPTWKFIGSRNLSVGIAMAQLLGFPATYLIANEVATASTDDPEEREVVLKRIMPAYVVAGLASVTTLSIVIAGVFAQLL